MPKISEKIFLNEISYTLLTNKENELLNRDFRFKNIDELVESLNNTKAEEEYIELFNRISKRIDILKKINRNSIQSCRKKKN